MRRKLGGFVRWDFGEVRQKFLLAGIVVKIYPEPKDTEKPKTAIILFFEVWK